MTDIDDLQVLLLAWCFTSLLQGVAGFGVPVAVVAPIMVIMKFKPLFSIIVCLIGHSWAISFGSMGSSYNSIQLVTGIPGQEIAPQMALLFAVVIFATGFEVMYIYKGTNGIKQNFFVIVTTASVMSFTMWLMTYLGAAQVASLMSGLNGCLSILLWSKLKRNKTIKANGVIINSNLQQNEVSLPFYLAAMPYLLVIVITLLLQLAPLKSALKNVYLGLYYPFYTTPYGFFVKEEKAFSKITLFSHPAIVLLLSAFIGGIIYIKIARSSKTIFVEAAKDTIKKAIPVSIGICTMVMMSLVIANSGMTTIVAKGVAKIFGSFYPFISPFVGVLGTFITDSNTSSNVMFGQLQFETGVAIGASSTLLSASQSVGGSLGVSIAPATVMMNTANLDIEGQENCVIRTNIKCCILNAALVGIIVLMFA